MLKKILTWPAKSLKKDSIAVTKFDEDLKNSIIDLVDTCRVNFGVGIAAPQIGLNQKIVVIKTEGLVQENISPSSYNPDYMVLINPIIEVSGEDIEWKEACLSIPGVDGKVKRKDRCSVVFMDENGETKKLEAGWPFSGVLQHETDHLNGFLYHMRMDKRKKTGLMWKFNRNKRKKYIEERKRRRNVR
jgi:peptide deformylase